MELTMSKAETKAARLRTIEDLLLAHPGGLTQAEIAHYLDVNRSTVYRYLPDLPQHIYIDEMDGCRWKIDRQAYLVNVRFNLNEAMAIGGRKSNPSIPKLQSCILAEKERS